MNKKFIKITVFFSLFGTFLLSKCLAGEHSSASKSTQSVEALVKSISSKISEVKKINEIRPASLKEKFKSQKNSEETSILNSRRGIAIMAMDPSKDLDRKLKGFKDDDEVVTVTFRFTGSENDKNFMTSLYKSPFFTEILNNSTDSGYVPRWKNSASLIIEGVMSKQYFATLKYYQISDNQTKKMRQVTSFDPQECTSDKGFPSLNGRWKPGQFTEFDAGPRQVAKFGVGYKSKSFLDNPYFEFDKDLSIEQIFSSKRPFTGKNSLRDMNLENNKFYYTLPNGKVGYGFYSITLPRRGQANDIIREWVSNRKKFKCLRDSVS